MDRRVEARIVAAERALLDPAIRTDPAELERWLDPACIEIGQSGTFWTREAILDAPRKPPRRWR